MKIEREWSWHRVEDELSAAIESITTLALFISDKDDTESKGVSQILLDQSERLRRVQAALDAKEA